MFDCLQTVNRRQVIPVIFGIFYMNTSSYFIDFVCCFRSSFKNATGLSTSDNLGENKRDYNDIRVMDVCATKADNI